MSELMEWDGPWSPSLINAMIPVAVEIETKREQALGRPLISAVASLTQGGTWKTYSDSLEEVLRMVKREQLILRGATREDIRSEDADELAQMVMNLKGLKRG